jgi:histidinol-phosphatase
MFEHELAFANGVADRADRIAMDLFRGAGLAVREKADRSLVTQADIEIERMVREQLAAAFPDDRILGEEEGGDYRASGRIWICDPIDATSNFARGIPVWGTLLALHADGVPVLGLASAPALGERAAAVKGGGATFNGEPATVSDIGTLGEATVLHARLGELLEQGHATAMLGLVGDAARDRAFGDFWGHLLVARGAAEVMIEPGLKLWDYAALQVIVEEAGGRMTTIEGDPPRHEGSLVTTNGLLHDEVLSRLAAGR